MYWARENVFIFQTKILARDLKKVRHPWSTIFSLQTLKYALVTTTVLRLFLFDYRSTSVEVSEDHSWFQELTCTLYVSLFTSERVKRNDFGRSCMGLFYIHVHVCSYFAFHLSSLSGLFKLGQNNLFECGRNLQFHLGLLNVENFCRKIVSPLLH